VCLPTWSIHSGEMFFLSWGMIWTRDTSPSSKKVTVRYMTVSACHQCGNIKDRTVGLALSQKL
jgi:hypothetical protein